MSRAFVQARDGGRQPALVAYTLRITDVDPLKYKLLFERFLNPERISMPDIDIDFNDERRDEVIAYVAKNMAKGMLPKLLRSAQWRRKQRSATSDAR